MFRDIVEIITDSFILIFIVLIAMFFFTTTIKQENTIQFMNEVIRTNAISNIDHSSRVQKGKLYLSKSDFENDVITSLNNDDNNLFSSETVYNFEYLETEDEAIKSIRLNLISEGKQYQSTVVVDIAEE